MAHATNAKGSLTGEASQACRPHGDHHPQVASSIRKEEDQDRGPPAHRQAVPRRERRRLVGAQARNGGLGSHEHLVHSCTRSFLSPRPSFLLAC